MRDTTQVLNWERQYLKPKSMLYSYELVVYNHFKYDIYLYTSNTYRR